MEFGYVDGKLSEVDFSLLADTKATIKTLQAIPKGGELKVYVGGTKWADKSWRGKVYPREAPESDFLKIYAKNFNTIEFGPTFYSIYKPEELLRWTKQVEQSPGFRFCPKFPQAVTHVRRLVNAGDETRKFYESLSSFGSQLGPLLLQLGENISPKGFPQLKSYLEALPPGVKVALEVRHKDWFGVPAHRNALFELLNHLGIAWVMSDTKGRRDCIHMQLPTRDAVIRFVGNNLDATDYSRIDEWLERIKTWQQLGLQSLWFFVHQFDEGVVPDLCYYLVSKLNTELGMTLKAPELISTVRNRNLF